MKYFKIWSLMALLAFGVSSCTGNLDVPGTYNGTSVQLDLEGNEISSGAAFAEVEATNIEGRYMIKFNTWHFYVMSENYRYDGYVTTALGGTYDYKLRFTKDHMELTIEEGDYVYEFTGDK